MKEHGESVDAELKAEVEGKIAEVRLILAQEEATAESLRAAAESLNESLMKVGQAIYSRQQENPANADDDAPPSEDPPTDEAVEGEYREV